MEPAQRDWGRFLSNFNNSEFEHPESLEPNAEQLNSIKLNLGSLFVHISEILPTLRASEEAKQHLQEIINKSLAEVKSSNDKNKQAHGEVITQLCQHIFQNVNRTIPNALLYPKEEGDEQELHFLDQKLIKQSSNLARSIEESLKNETRNQLSKTMDPQQHSGYAELNQPISDQKKSETNTAAKELQASLRLRLQRFPTEQPPKALVENLNIILEKQTGFEWINKSLVDKLHHVWEVNVPHSVTVRYFLDPKVSKEQRLAILASGNLFKGHIGVGDLSSMVAIIREQFTDDQLLTLMESGMDNSGLSKLLLTAYQEFAHFEVQPSLDKDVRNAQLYLLKKILDSITPMDSLIGIVMKATPKPPAELVAFKYATVVLKCEGSMSTYRYPEVFKLALISPVFDKLLHRYEQEKKVINDEITLNTIPMNDLHILLNLADTWQNIPKAVLFINQLYQNKLQPQNIFSNLSTFKFFQLPPHLFIPIEARIDQKLKHLVDHPDTVLLHQLFFDQLLPCFQSAVALDLTDDQMELMMRLYKTYLPKVKDFDEKMNLYRMSFYFAQRLSSTSLFIQENEALLPELCKNLVEHRVTDLLEESDYLVGLEIIKQSYSYLQPFEGFEVKSLPLKLNLIGMPATAEHIRQLKGLPLDEIKLTYSPEFNSEVREELKGAFPDTRIEYVNLPFTEKLGNLIRNT